LQEPIGQPQAAARETEWN